MKRTSSLCILAMVGSIIGCGNSHDALTIHDWGRDAILFGVGYLGFNLLGENISGLEDRIDSLEDQLSTSNTTSFDDTTTVIAIDGTDGIGGLNCWDLNGNGVEDPDEDVNGDGVFDALDCQGVDGVNGSNGPAGSDGEGFAPLFNTFIDDFFTVENGSYEGISLEADDLPVVEIYEPAIGYCNYEEVGVVAFRVPIPTTYPGNNPVTMRLFIWRTGEKNDNCMVFRLDAFRSRHGLGVSAYGSPRFITLDDPTDPDPTGTLLVVDLPLNNETENPIDGLCFPNDLVQGDLLAFELSNVNGFSDGGCFSIIGVEMYESNGFFEDLQVTHAKIAKSFETIECNEIVDCETVHNVPEGKTILCHNPPGDESNTHTIMVNDNAVARHVEIHGDTEGPCPGDCEEE